MSNFSLPARSFRFTLTERGERMIEVIGSPVQQHHDEEIAYTIDTTRWGGTPTSISVTAVCVDTGVVVTGTVLSGSASAAGNIVTLPVFGDADAGLRYRIEITFTSSGSTLVCFLFVEVE